MNFDPLAKCEIFSGYSQKMFDPLANYSKMNKVYFVPMIASKNGSKLIFQTICKSIKLHFEYSSTLAREKSRKISCPASESKFISLAYQTLEKVFSSNLTGSKFIFPSSRWNKYIFQVRDRVQVSAFSFQRGPN